MATLSRGEKILTKIIRFPNAYWRMTHVVPSEGAVPSISWPYLAGFYDGEGTVGLYNYSSSKTGGTGYINVSMAQQSPMVLHAIQRFLVEYGIRTVMLLSKATPLSAKSCHRLEVARGDALKFLYYLMPYLVVKKAKVQDILRFKKIFPPLSRKICGMLAAETRWGARVA